MDSPSSREEFGRYLKRSDSDSLMGYVIVENWMLICHNTYIGSIAYMLMA